MTKSDIGYTCSKCGSPQTRIDWKKAGEREYLACFCYRCSYRWEEDTVDSKRV